ncbi:DNA topoisomerase III [Motiliproteus sp. SC1-56]|uniref:DNA topoisomerase III n=1 Tax=Motiliproteus sp. SC1-56 TaxID=2799565 RepID=UPI001A8CD5BC|nr:DNA topoisomerase III [Motiliproteus sp. SC1-56]
MKLYIAEKPSLGRAIAAVLPKPQRKEQGCIHLGNGDCVTWCIGHLLEQAEPHAYDPAFKRWGLEALPIVPERWQLTPRAKVRSQLAVIRRLVKQADTLVHAGDPDREGQLLIDEVIDYLGVPAAKRAGTQRCLISDLTPAAVRRALQNLRPNREFVPLSTSALARARADWLVGINLTRACTLQGQRVGYRGVLSVGRVQTPVLGLVVNRDREIEHFVSRPFYAVRAHLETAGGDRFTADWRPSEACRPHMDEEGRVLSRPLAEHVVRRIQGQPARVLKVEEKTRRRAPPLPYNLSALQIDAARLHGLSAQQVLDTCQALYERHKLITYPRSDCRYLPAEQHAHAPQVAAALAGFSEGLDRARQGADFQLRSQAWNDSRVGAHHAIIPTSRPVQQISLSNREAQVYRLVARQYLAQFYPAQRYLETKVDLEITGGLFQARARRILETGWKALFERDRQKDADGDTGESESNALPPLAEGDEHLCREGELLEKQTQSPKAFTDATLMAAMTGIARFVRDPEVRRILKETDGLGTEATRAGIVELLFKRGFLRREGKAIRATAAGQGLVDSLPEELVRPDMTARWESQLAGISERRSSYAAFMQPLTEGVARLVAETTRQLPRALEGVKAERPPKGRLRPRRGGCKPTTRKRRGQKPVEHSARKARRTATGH